MTVLYRYYLSKICDPESAPAHEIEWWHGPDSAPDFNETICTTHGGPYRDQTIKKEVVAE